MNQEYITNLKGLLDKYTYSDYEKQEINNLISFEDYIKGRQREIEKIKQMRENNPDVFND